MAYVPFNLQIFTAAFAGALAGMGASGRVISDPIPADYAGLTNVAGAFAQSLDTTWGANPTSELDIQTVEEACEGVWQGREPRTVAPFLTPSTYNTLAAAVVAMVLAGDAYFASQGITPPAPPNNNPTEVANLAALTALSLSGVNDQSEVKVGTLDCWWEILTSAAIPDGITIVPSSVVGRLWFRKIASVPQWTEQNIYKVSNLTGDNEATGLPGFPVKNLSEVCRRVLSWKIFQPSLPQSATTLVPSTYYDIQALDDVPTTDVWRPTGTVNTAESSQNNVYSWVLRGVRTTYLAGTVTAGTVASAPATNTAAAFNGGAVFDPVADPTLIGKLIVVPNGIGNGLDVVAWIQRSTVANQAQVSEWGTFNPNIINPPFVLLTAGQVSGTLVGKPYTIVNTTAMACSMMSVGVFFDRQRYQDLTFPTNAIENISLRGITGNFLTCRVQQRLGVSVSGGVVLNACGVDFAALTDWTVAIGAPVLAIVGSSIKNTSLTVTGNGVLLTVNSVIDGGFIETNTLTTQASQTANNVANAYAGGQWSNQGQTGIFNSPKSGVIIKRGGQAQISASIYGSSNTFFGLEALEGGKVFVLSSLSVAANLKITGTSGDIQLDSGTLATPVAGGAGALQSIDNVTAGVQSGTGVLVAGVSAVIPAVINATSRIEITMKDPGGGVIIGLVALAALVADRVIGQPGSFIVKAISDAGVVLPTATCTFDWAVTNTPPIGVPLSTWVQWDAPIVPYVSGFARNASSGKSGASIISVGTT